jgi:hypothetical protein
VLLSLCIAIYYYFAVSTAQNITSWWTKIILTVVLTLFMGWYLFVDALGVWVGSKILGWKWKFVDTFIVTLSIAMLYFTNEVIHYILELAIGSIIATIIKFILWICILIFSIKTLSKVQEFSWTRSFLSIILSGILIYVWTLFFFFIVVFLIMLIFWLSLIWTF